MTSKATHHSTSRPEMLWYCDYHDHIRTGICRYEGNMCWFEVTNEKDENIGRNELTYQLYELSPEAQAEHVEIQRRFFLYVGEHTTFPKSDHVLREKSLWPRFYDWYNQQQRPYQSIPRTKMPLRLFKLSAFTYPDIPYFHED